MEPMSALLDQPDTVIPTDADAKLAAESSRVLRGRRRASYASSLTTAKR
jgi:hypothetical protein